MTMEKPTQPGIEQVAELSARVIQEVEKAVIGKREALQQMMAAFLSSGGHILLEDYPGLAKTLIANSFATALGMDFQNASSLTPISSPEISPGDMCLKVTRTVLCCAKARSLPTSCWPMRSTGLLRDAIGFAGSHAGIPGHPGG